jgi:hypothetical protein
LALGLPQGKSIMAVVFFWGGFKSKATHPDLANKKGKFTDPNGDLKGVQPIDKNKHKTWWDG